MIQAVLTPAAAAWRLFSGMAEDRNVEILRCLTGQHAGGGCSSGWLGVLSLW